MKKSSEYRALAREQLGGQIFAANWLWALLALVLFDALVGICSFGAGIGAMLAEGFFGFGIAVMFLKRARNNDGGRMDISDIFAAKDCVANSLLLGLLRNIFICLWSLLFLIPGIIKAYSYSMSSFILADHPEYDWNTCLTESRKMMKGHKWQLFCLRLSFIGWLLLSAVTFGIAALWVAPYIQASVANFYEDVKAQPAIEDGAANA